MTPEEVIAAVAKKDPRYLTLTGSGRQGNRPVPGPCPSSISPDPWSDPVLVPPFPPLKLSPTSDRAVVVPVVGESGRKLWAVSGPKIAAYAARVKADLVVLTDPGPPTWPMGAKFGIGRVLDWYERMVGMDADVICGPQTVNLFDECRPDEFGAFDDLPHIVSRHPAFPAEYARFRQFMDLPVLPDLPWYLNTGVFIASRRHRAVLTPPVYPVPPLHCGEQHWWNASLHDFGTSVRRLSDKCNHQWWIHRDEWSPPRDAVVHFSGLATQPDVRLAMMKYRSRQAEVETYPCIYRGDRAGERRECVSGCGKGKMIPLQTCKVFGKCTVAASVGKDVKCCKTCTSRLPPGQSSNPDTSPEKVQ